MVPYLSISVFQASLERLTPSYLIMVLRLQLRRWPRAFTNMNGSSWGGNR